MIIQCPECGRRFTLQRRPPEIFRCPKCSFSVPFNVLLSEQKKNSQPEPTTTSAPTHADVTGAGAVANNETRVVSGLQQNGNAGADENYGKTQLVSSLQMKRNGEFAVTFNGQNYGVVKLPNGKSFTVGRRSSDSKAQIQLTPDIAMSRIHAGMRTVQVNGQVVYQITSAKANNPVFVNAMPIAPGKACNLKTGDKVQMGNTVLVFRMV